MRRTGSLGWVLSLGWLHRRRVVLAAAAGMAGAGAAVGLTATSAWLISRAAERPPVLYLMVAIVAVRAFGVARGALRYAERLAAHDVAFRVLADLRLAAYRRLRALAPSGLAQDRSGDLLARIVTDIDGLADVWLRVALPYVVAATIGGATVLLIGTILPLAGLALALSLVTAGVAAPLLAAVVARRAEASVAPTRGALAGEALELLRGAPELLISDACEPRLRAVGAIDRRLRDAEARSALGSGLGTLVTELAQGSAVWLGLVLGVLALRAGAIGGVALAVVVLTPIAAHELIGGVAPAAQQLPRVRSAARRLSEVLARPDPVREPDRPIRVPRGPYGLRLRRVCARYPAGSRDVLRGVDLDLRAGERALVTGGSGTGKSTLAALLLRQLDPSSGTVELVTADGSVELSALAGDDVRGIIGLCAQDPHLFDTSLRENLRIARPDATDAELLEAIGAARLGAWVASLPGGLDTLVGEHGARVSGGQRQRIELARTLLGDRPVLVFDELTEHLDEATATALMADTLALTAGRTALFITHRPALMAAVHPMVTIDLGATPADAVGDLADAGEQGVRPGHRLSPGPTPVPARQ